MPSHFVQSIVAVKPKYSIVKVSVPMFGCQWLDAKISDVEENAVRNGNIHEL